MSDVVGKISRTAKKVVRKTTKKVEEIASVTKYSIKLKAKDSELEEKLEVLGKMYYSYVKREKKISRKEIRDYIKEIDALNEEIDELKAMIAEAKANDASEDCEE